MHKEIDWFIKRYIKQWTNPISYAYGYALLQICVGLKDWQKCSESKLISREKSSNS